MVDRLFYQTKTSPISQNVQNQSVGNNVY